MIRADQKCDSAAMERSARFVAVLLLRHSGSVAAEFSENRDRLFADIVEPINTYAVVGVGVFRDLETCLFDHFCIASCAFRFA